MVNQGLKLLITYKENLGSFLWVHRFTWKKKKEMV